MADKELTDTDMNPGPVKGVGDSEQENAEDTARRENEPDRHSNQGTKGESNRPYGTSDARDATSIDPQEAVEGKTMPPGDQGG
jgi:hypothetical protein